MPLPRWPVATLCLAGCLLAGALGASAATDDGPPPWAYGFKTPAGETLPPAPPAKVAAPDPTHYGLPGTDLKFTRAELSEIFNPADFYPEDHATPPAIVAHGKAPDIWACARCHYANGKGRPENAGLAGLPIEYFIAELQSFRRGERTSSDARKPNTKMMSDYARGMSDEEIRAAAGYFGAMKWTPWIRVVETARVPRTEVSAGMYLQIPNGGDEPLGDRIIEVPENPDAVEITRSPRVGFIAYVPVGSVQRGAVLVTTGREGRTMACATCHGPALNGGMISGFGAVPGIAGRSPSYLMRQLFDLKTGHRKGPRTILMQPVVANLSTDDMRDIVAYLSSRPVSASIASSARPPASTAP
ncbi:MAG TPA: c-type cytochrome [Candidatus Didemnitutus sp.]|jgi:cytochrome c553